MSNTSKFQIAVIDAPTDTPTTDPPTTDAPITDAPTTNAPSLSNANISLARPEWSSTRAIWLKLKYKSGAKAISADSQFERASSDLKQVAKFAVKTLSDCRAYLRYVKKSPHAVLTANLNNYYSDDEASETSPEAR